MAGGALRLRGLSKDFDGIPAVRGIDLDIAAGEFFSLLGPSGCGKTTTLRMVAGFERPSGGEILLDGVDLSDVPSHRRPVNTVFQSYALFPFMSVHDNVGFGLRYSDSAKSDARRRVDDALALVRMSEYAARRPGQLSGGQQQRVALARALVLGPRVLLLDEPLGALDAKLRKELQIELKALQERVGVTFVYVTHDQEEALTMSDRLAVMADGRVEQVGTPAEVYEQPANAYVADFLGAANVLGVDVVGPASTPGGTSFRVGDRLLVAGPPSHAPGPARLVARPERLRLLRRDADPGPNSLDATVERTVYLGSSTQVVVRLAGGESLIVSLGIDHHESFAAGELVSAVLPPEALRLLPAGGPALAPVDPDAARLSAEASA